MQRGVDMKKNKMSTIPEARTALESFKTEYSQELGIYSATNLDLSALASRSFGSSKTNIGNVRKIVVNGEESLINNREYDPNP